MPRALRFFRRVSAQLGLGAILCSTSLACAANQARGPQAWPLAPELAETAQAQSRFEAARPLVAALFSGHGLEALLGPRAAHNLASADHQRALRRIRRRLGPLVGVHEERMHREDGVLWYSGLWVHGGRIPQLLLVQFSLDEGGAVDRLLVRRHRRRDEATHPADSYETVNRFRLPAAGMWFVSQGGPTPETNKHHADAQQRWAYDLVVEKRGKTRSASARGIGGYFAHGQDYLAPAPGRIVYARGDQPETPAGTKGKGGGNGIIIDHGFGEYSASWHFVPGTIRVAVGDWVEVGQVLATVGNSGRSSQPHIHLHLASGPPGTASKGLPLRFSDVILNGQPIRLAEPTRGESLRNTHPSPPAPAPARPDVFLEL